MLENLDSHLAAQQAPLKAALAELVRIPSVCDEGGGGYPFGLAIDQALRKTLQLAGDLGQELCAVLVGSGVSGLAQEAIAFGAEKVYVVDDPLLKDYQTDSYVSVMEKVIKQVMPQILLLGQNTVGRDLVPALAFRLGTAANLDCVELAIDADSNSNLAAALGIPHPEKIIPLSEMSALIEERTGAKKGTFGSMFKLNPKVDDLPDEMGVTYEGVKLLLLGSIPQGGGGCFCPESVILKNLIQHLFVQKEEAVIIDMEAGLEHLGRGSTGHVDALIVVVEPGQRSINTAKQIKALGEDLVFPRFIGTGVCAGSFVSRRFRQTLSSQHRRVQAPCLCSTAGTSVGAGAGRATRRMIGSAQPRIQSPTSVGGARSWAGSPTRHRRCQADSISGFGRMCRAERSINIESR
jgi:CO dehydrogenase maturation factor